MENEYENVEVKQTKTKTLKLQFSNNLVQHCRLRETSWELMSNDTEICSIADLHSDFQRHRIVQNSFC